MYRLNLKSVALPVPEIIAIEVLGGSCEPQSWGKGGSRGSGMVLFERALVGSYRPPIVTFPLSLCVSEILPLVCSSTPLFPPTSSLPHISPCSLGVGGWPLAMKSEGVGLIVRSISFQDFQPARLRKTIFSARLCFGRSRSSEVSDFGIN